jgi:Flp pilus assembly protein TadD
VNYRAGNLGTAVQILRSAVEDAPDMALFHYHLGMALRDHGDVEGAKEHLARALELGDFTGADKAREALAEL